MARLYADEQFPLPVVRLLREMGHDILTVQEAGNTSASDPAVLAFATTDDRAVLTQNRRHFIKLHNQAPEHAGIVSCTTDSDVERLALRINEAIAAAEPLAKKLIRVRRSF